MLENQGEAWKSTESLGEALEHRGRPRQASRVGEEEIKRERERERERGAKKPSQIGPGGVPAAMARNISSSPQKMVIYSIIGGLLSVILGLFSSLEFNTASGPSIIAASLFLFILSLLNIKQSIKLKN